MFDISELFFSIGKGVFKKLILFLDDGRFCVEQNIECMNNKHMRIVLKFVELFIRRKLIGYGQIKRDLIIFYL